MPSPTDLRTPRRRHSDTTDLAAVSVSELFDPDTAIDGLPAPEITLGALAVSLNVPTVRLRPLAEHGYLTITKPSSVLGGIVVRTPPQRAVRWLRQWFMPARAKTLFSAADISELLNLPQREVVKLAARFDLPTTFDPALGGLLWSTYAVRMMLRAISGMPAEERIAPRFDRQALLHVLLETDLVKQLRPPTFVRALEDEISRVATLPLPERAIRSAALWGQWLDAKAVAEACPAPPVPTAVAQIERKILRLRGNKVWRK
jgi:hypothetical protein